MAIAKMKLIDLTGDVNKLDETLSYFIDFHGFHPVESDKIVGTVHGLTSYQTANPCLELLNEVREIEADYGLKLKEVKVRKVVDSLDEIHDYIVKSHQVLKADVDRIRNIESEINSFKKAIQQIENIESLDISLDDLFQAKYISVRFGKIPKDSLERIKYYRNKPFVFVDFEEEEHHVWCMYFMANSYEREIDNIMSSLFFDRIYIPDFVHGTPELAKKNLIKQITDKEALAADIKNHLFELTTHYVDKLAVIKGELEFLNQLHETKKYVVGLGNKFLISGFIEKKNVDKFKKHFSEVDTVEIDVRPSNSDKRLTPPTKLKNNWFTKPFEMFVEMYGLPSYKEIDPTLFVALTYTLLFGIMFGDVGQGIVISLVGLLMAKWKKMALGPILVRIGASSAFFGLIYGSVFGNETWLASLYSQMGITFLPLHVMSGGMTMNLLIATVILGAVLILIAIGINIYIKLKHKHYGEALFSSNGIAGFLFYATILVGVGLQMTTSIKVFNPFVITLLIIIPILLIFLKEPLERLLAKEKMFPTGFGGFFVEGFFELFEVMLSYVTNTMSFLRVGGFILSHAGMMLVVHTLMDMAGNGSIVVSIFGNIFVMGLEGLIVGIQVLRLEFYEMFSRYYEGNGVAFKPL